MKEFSFKNAKMFRYLIPLGGFFVCGWSAGKLENDRRKLEGRNVEWSKPDVV
jgi:hypothetical protein